MLTSTIEKIKKRSGEIVPFTPDKIMIAVGKAMTEVRGSADPAVLGRIAKDVMEKLEARFGSDLVPTVEDVQNVVEYVLMQDGGFDIAKSYIIYRYEHQKQREAKKREVLNKIEEAELFITKRNGTREVFSLAKLKKSLSYVVKGYEQLVDIDVIANQIRMEIYEDIPTVEIERSMIMVLRSWIEQDPGFSYVASRALLVRNYKEVIGYDEVDFSKLDSQLRASFVKNIYKAVGIGKLDPKMLTFDFEDLAKELDFSRDGLHSYLSTQTLVDRYFIFNPDTKEILETLQTFWMRVAMGMALNEKDRNGRAKEFYHVMSQLLYIPSTPTLFHAGTSHPQLSSCYLTTIDDSLDHIFKCISDNAQLSKWSGGIGNDWTNLRGIGALIRGTGVSSQGTIPFLKIANDTTAAINRSGRRRGATCAFMETWHWDIEDFLELRKNTGDERRRTHDMNTANWIPDLFMKRVRDDGQWSLFSPDETPDLHHLYGKAFDKRFTEYEEKGARGELRLYRSLKARDLWKKMIGMLFETGHPWITFKDPCNVRSPQDHVGVVHSSNLCTEITLNTSSDETAVCNLGSIHLENHIIDGKFDIELLAKSVRTAMRMLDNVIDINFYPTKEAYNSNMRHRPVGLGIMGLQHALYKLDIQFDSEAGVDFSDYSMEAVSYFTIAASAELAKERGSYASYRGSKWDRGIFPVDTIALLEEERGEKINVPRTERFDWAPIREVVKKYGMRNSNCMAIAPTATISNIANTTPSMEPIYKNIYVKANQAGDFTVINPYLVEDLKKINLWDSEMLGKLKYNDGRIVDIPEIPQKLKDKYKEVFQISPEWLIKAAAYRGKWIDQSQSLNIFYAGKSGREMNAIYLYAWEMGVKTTYYLRTLAVSQVEKSTVSTSEFGSTHMRKTNASEAAPESSTPVTMQSLPQKPEPVAAMSAPEPIEPPVKLCKINDPDCEACQ